MSSPHFIKTALLSILAAYIFPSPVWAQAPFELPPSKSWHAAPIQFLHQDRLLALRLHPRNPHTDLPELPPETLNDLKNAAGVPIEPAGKTSSGEFLLRVPNHEDLIDTINTIRMNEHVVWISMVPDTAPEMHVARAMTAPVSSPLYDVYEFRVVLNEPASQTARSRQDTLPLALIASLQQALHKDVELIRPMSGGAWVFAFPEPIPLHEAEDAMNRLRALPEVESAYLSQPVSTQRIPNDPLFQTSGIYGQYNLLPPGRNSPWGGTIIGIDAVRAWDITTGSPNIRVAIVDTGVLPNHPDLQGRLLQGWNFIDGNADTTDPGDYCDSEVPPTRSSWHGTHIAGTIAANTNDGIGAAGIDWNARIIPVRVLGQCGGRVSNAIDGLRWAAGLQVPGAPVNTHPARIINLSLSSPAPCDSHWQAAINEVTAAGSLVVVAAGNYNEAIDQYSPASCDGVITVTASDPHGAEASYSNYGMLRLPALSAPGGDLGRIRDFRAGIIAAGNLGLKEPTSHGWLSMSGTSMAAPHVAGVASLMLAVDPTLTPAQLHSLITRSDNLTAFPGISNQPHRGRGILNAHKAVRAAQTNRPPEGPLLLRDAIYLYNLPLSASEGKTLTGIDCDVFKLTLDVATGRTSISMGDAVSLPGALAIQTPYADIISENDRMFAYSRYGTQPVKTFSLRAANAPETTDSTVTAFGYCFSRSPQARAYLHDPAHCENTYSNGRKTSCQLPDNGVGSSAPTQMSLRDAIYLYDEEVPRSGNLHIGSRHCEVLQLLLDVEAGHTAIRMHEGSRTTAYPDQISETADMFAYALYGNDSLKGFSLGNASVESSTPSNRVTAFAYCYSTRNDAYVFKKDPGGQLCSRSSGAHISCP